MEISIFLFPGGGVVLMPALLIFTEMKFTYTCKAVISFMLCYVSSENAGSQEKMPLPKCRWRHFVLPAFSLAFVLWNPSTI